MKDQAPPLSLMIPSRLIWLCCLFSASVFSAGLNVSTLQNAALEQPTGIVEINMASGNSTAQSNGVALAVSRGGPAIALVTSEQTIDEDSVDATQSDASAQIESGAISNGMGIVMINQSSGDGNAQVNGIAISLGIEGEAIADSELDQSVSNQELSPGGPNAPLGFRDVSMGNGAIQDSQGVIQVNQAAGSWNATANSFALRVSVSAQP